MRNTKQISSAFMLLTGVAWAAMVSTNAVAELRAGVAKVDITDQAAGPVNDPLFAKALVLSTEDTTVVLITVDAVAIGEIGPVSSAFLPSVRGQLQETLGIPPAHVLVNASHCHGLVRADADQLTVQAVKEAWSNLAPVRAGAGVAQEERISENRRLSMKDGSEVDMRRAYALPPDEDVAAVGPIDPEVGLLRLDRLDGRPLAIIYNFACHPIMNPPGTGNSADFPGFASKVIEAGLGNGAVALFIQGCGGDINPIRYKDVQRPPSAEPLGNMLGVTVLDAVRSIETQATGKLSVASEVIALPRGVDLERRIAAIETEQVDLVRALTPTDINFKTFLPLYIEQKISPEFPSYYAQGYLHEKMLGREDWTRLDAANRQHVNAYLENIAAMERLTRLNVNLALLKQHLAQNQAAGSDTLDAEISGLRVGDFHLITFPGELTVEIGLNLKLAAPSPFSFIAGYTNGYLYYLPTAAQRNNTGYAQEDCDSLVAPEWQAIFEAKALQVLNQL